MCGQMKIQVRGPVHPFAFNSEVNIHLQSLTLWDSKFLGLDNFFWKNELEIAMTHIIQRAARLVKIH